MRGPIKCADCPTIIQNPWPNQSRCVPCGDKKRAAQVRERASAYYHRKKPVAGTVAVPQVDKPQHSKAGALTWELKGKSGTQIEIEARALGLTYGQYGALIRSGMIERHCKDMGLETDGLQYVANIWKEFEKQKAEREKANLKGHRKMKTINGT